MPKTILLVGATGFIGSYVLEELLSQGYKVVILKRSTSDLGRINEVLNNIRFYDIDRCDIDRPFSENKIDFVINMAVDYGRRKKALQSELVTTNITFALQLIEKAIEYKIGHYFNIDTHLSESVNFYAYTKKILKDILRREFTDKIKIFNLRLEYVYGPKDDESKFIPFAISKLKKNKDLDMSMGEQKLDFIHVKDCALAIAHIIQNHELFKGSFEEFQIGTGNAVSLKEFVESLKKHLSSTSKINYGKIPYRQNEQMFSEADISRLRGWEPKYNFKDLE